MALRSASGPRGAHAPVGPSAARLARRVRRRGPRPASVLGRGPPPLGLVPPPRLSALRPFGGGPYPPSLRSGGPPPSGSGAYGPFGRAVGAYGPSVFCRLAPCPLVNVLDSPRPTASARRSHGTSLPWGPSCDINKRDLPQKKPPDMIASAAPPPRLKPGDGRRS